MSLSRLLLPLASALLLAETAFSQAPANDNFADRIDLGTTVPVDVTASVLEATLEESEPPFFDPEQAGTVWWEWEAPEAGDYLFRTTSPPNAFGFSETSLVLFTGNSFSSLQDIAQAINNVFENDISSSILLPFERGQKVAIQASGYFTSPESLRLEIMEVVTPSIASVSKIGDTPDISSGDAATTMVDLEIEAVEGIAVVAARLINAQGRQVDSAVFDLDPTSGTNGITRTAGDAFAGTYRVALDVPPYYQGGDWTLRFSLRDSAGISSFYGGPINYGEIGFVRSLPELNDAILPVINNGEVDSTPPELTALFFDPPLADVTNGDRQVTVTVGVTDDTGIASISGGLFEEGRRKYSFGTLPGQPVTGTVRAGSYQSTFTIPGRIPAVRLFPQITITDSVGNRRTFGTETLPFPDGVTTEFDIINTGMEDMPPTLTSITVTPLEIDVTAAASEVAVRIEATDDFTSVNAASIRIGGGAFSFGRSIGRSSETSPGVFETTIPVPRYFAPGTYPVTVRITDETNRTARYGGTDLAFPNGSTTEVSVVNTGIVDTLRPSITRFTVFPETVDVSNGPVDVTVSFDATDDIGITSLFVEAQDTTTGQPIFSAESEVQRISGDAAEGTYEWRITVPARADAGRWELLANLRDEFGRSAFYGAFGSVPFPQDTVSAIEIINDAGPDLPPMLNALTFTPNPIDFTRGDGLVAVRLEASDDFSELTYVELSIDAGGERISELYIKGGQTGLRRTAPGIFEGELFFPSFIEPGDYPIEVILQTDIAPGELPDDSSNFTRYGPEGLAFPEGIDSVITIADAGPIDSTPPEITRVSIFPTSIDVTSGPRDLEIEVDAGDDTALTNLSVALRSQAGQEFTLSTQIAGNRIVGDVFSGIYRGTITVPGHIAPGILTASITASDPSGNFTTFGGDGASPFPGEWDAEVTVINTGAVGTPPVLVSLELDPAPIDITSGPREVAVRAVTTDDFSVIERAQISFRVEGRLIDAYLSNRSGTSPGELSGTLRIPGFLPSGTYDLSLMLTGDILNSSTYGAPGGGEFPEGILSSVEIINNSTADTSAPELTEFTLEPASVDVATGPQEVTYRVAASDDIGIQKIDVVFIGEGGITPESPPTLVSGTPQNGIYEGTITVPGYLAPQTYEAHVTLTDISRQSRRYHGLSMLPSRSNGILAVTNSGTPNTPPQITAFSVSPSFADVTVGAQALAVRLELAQDDDPLTALRVAAVFGELYFSAELESFTETAPGVFEGTIEIPALAQPGLYQLSISLEDARGGATRAGRFNLPADAASFIEVQNTGAIDLGRPDLFSLNYSPNPLSRDRLPATVTVTAGITDDLSGVIAGGLTFFSSAEQELSTLASAPFFEELTLAAGESTAGIFQFEVTFDQLPSPGRLYTSAVFQDETTRSTYYGDGRLPARGFPIGYEPLQIVDSYNDSYDAWVNAHPDIPATLTSPTADADGDGFPNGIEFYLGMGPMLDSHGTPQVPQIVIEDGNFGLRVPVAMDNLVMGGRTVSATPKAQWSRDGIGWRDIAAPEMVNATMTFLTPVDALGPKLMRFVVEFAPPE